MKAAKRTLLGLRSKAPSSSPDIMMSGIGLAAVILFVGTGGQVLPQLFRSSIGHGDGPDRLLATAMLLNIALILLGWRRVRQLARETALAREAEAEARKLAETDALTGCFNRRSIVPAAEALLAEARANQRAAAFFVLDLDNFKQVNDLHSHQAGDAVLQVASERLRESLPLNAIIARIGGDEFAVVVMFDPARPDEIDDLADLLVRRLSAPVEWQDASIVPAASIGLSRSDEDPGADVHALLHQADIAMFQSKRKGRNGICWFTPGMENELRFRSELEAGIRRGIAEAEFVPYYEQQIDVATGELVGFEMLARWHSRRHGQIGPDVFIPVAEEIGLIGELSDLLVRQSLRDASQWDARLTLAVNISPIQLRDPWFAQKLLKLLVEEGFPPHRLEIEITENSLHEDIGLVRTIITSLKNQGIRVSLDDFGTGYSSLAQLQILPFDRIKIDRSFISSLPNSDQSRAIVSSIVSLGEGLGIPVIAEGVETPAVLAALNVFSGLKAQGYLYGQPQPADQILQKLRDLHMDCRPDLKAEPTEQGNRIRHA